MEKEYVKLSEHHGRFRFGFKYQAEAVEIVKALPGAKWCPHSRSWSVSTRYQKRIAEAVARMEMVFASEAEAKASVLKALDDAAVDDPLPVVRGFRSYSRDGRWIIASPYDPKLVAAFKRIRGAKWSGTAWSFPAGARDELAVILNERLAEQIERDRPFEEARRKRGLLS